MRKERNWLGTIIAAQMFFCLATAAVAQDRQAALQLSGGIFNVGKSPTQVEAGLELRGPLRWWRLDLAGGLSASEEGSVWGYVGLRKDLWASEKFVIAPGFAVAVYEEGDGKDLGGSLQFRSALDFGYQLGSRARVGLTVYHLSNAGLEDFNPGANSVVLTYSVRL